MVLPMAEHPYMFSESFLLVGHSPKKLLNLGPPPGNDICSMQRGSTVDTMGAIRAITEC